MRVYNLATELWLPRTPEELFPFFAEAANLERITPPWLSFRITTPQPIDVRAGTRIDYRLRLHGVPVRWRTRITAWEPPVRFVDEQLRGPYRLWVHEHGLVAGDGGTWCRDRVRYAPPGGALANRLLVARDVTTIFAYRRAALRALFAGGEPAVTAEDRAAVTIAEETAPAQG